MILMIITSCYQNTELKSSDGYDGKSEDSDKSKSRQTDDTVTAKSEASHDHMAFLPLEVTQFQNITSSSTPFSVLSLDYRHVTIDQSGDKLTNSVIFSILYGRPRLPAYFNSVNELEGGLIISDYENISEEIKNHTFTTSEINVIFNYLLANQSYFFNADEFDGLTLPYITSNERIVGGNYEFVLVFYDPECDSLQYDLGWMISKATDELTPNHPLYGLVQLIENDFISQFE